MSLNPQELRERTEKMLDEDLAADAYYDRPTVHECGLCGESFTLDAGGYYLRTKRRAVCAGCEEDACDDCGLRDCDC